MKLSNKLLIGLITIITGIIIWQVIVSNRRINDYSILMETNDPIEKQSILNASKSYSRIPVNSFSNINIDDIRNIIILKGKEPGVYIEKFYKDYFIVSQEGDQINIKIKKDINDEYKFINYPIYVFTPSDLEEVEIVNSLYYVNNQYEVDINTIKIKNNKGIFIKTNPGKVNIIQEGGSLTLSTLNDMDKNSSKHLEIKIHVSNGEFRFRDAKTASLNADITLENSSIEFSPYVDTDLKKLKLTGSINEGNSIICLPASCDSLITHLVNLDNRSELMIRGEKAGYELIDLSENIKLNREWDLDQKNK